MVDGETVILLNPHIPIWARWIAQDEDGTWWAYEAEPHIAEKSWYENEVGRSARLVQTTAKAHWHQTLYSLTKLQH